MKIREYIWSIEDFNIRKSIMDGHIFYMVDTKNNTVIIRQAAPSKEIKQLLETYDKTKTNKD